MKLPIFIIGDNILSKHPERIYITHTQDPIFFAEVYHLHITDEAGQMERKQSFTIYSTLEHNDHYIVIGIRQMITDTGHTADQLAELMSRTGDWYSTYLDFEDIGEV
jgi:hypothetical protein